jgi:chromate transporter
VIALSLYAAFLKIGLFSIGGGYVMLPLIQREIIEVRGWLSLAEFLDILAVAEMTPGPVAINSATFIGYQTGGFWGAVFATAGVVTPSIVLMILAALFLKHFYENRWVQGVFSGLRPAAIALIAGAAIFVTRAAVADLTSAAFFAVALGLLLLTKLHPIVVLAMSAAAGLLMYL